MIGLADATVRFGQRTVLDRLSFSVAAGRCLAILGPNGRGKTTALRALLGFQPLAAGSRTAPPVVGYVPQVAPIVPRYRVLDVVVMGRAVRLGLFGQPGREDLDAARAALAETGVPHLAEAPFDRLSGGERQLVLLARALATGSPVLVFDEPAAALDLANQHRLLMLLDRLRQSRTRTMVLTTHDPNHALAAADDALLLLPHSQARHGPVREVVIPPHLEELYGVPMRVAEIDGTDGDRRNAILPAFTGVRLAA